MKVGRNLCVAAVLGLSACNSIAEPVREDEAPLQTDRLSYGFAENAGFYATPVIRLVLTNTSESQAFLATGRMRPELVLEGLDETGAWVTRYLRNVPDAGSGVLRLEPGETVTIETTIEGFLPGTCDCHPIIGFGDGIYRFRIAVGYVDSFDEELHESGDELPLEFRVSNSFALDAP